MSGREYRTDEAFKQALEDRLRVALREEPSLDLPRLRQLLVFERFMARIHEEFGESAVLKGGLALELRLRRARATRDVDLRVSGAPGDLLPRLRAAGARDLGDRLRFRVAPHSRHPLITGEALRYDGQRFRVEARLAGKLFGNPFGVDVGFGDRLFGPPNLLEGSRFLDFAGVAPARVLVYPRESHVAEKLHAYTQPRPRENTRVRDLPDLALMARTGSFHALDLRQAIEATFGFRGTHAIPEFLPAPPEAWEPRYRELATENSLAWPDLASVTRAARAFLDPVLEGADGTWDPSTWTWEAP